MFLINDKILINVNNFIYIVPLYNKSNIIGNTVELLKSKFNESNENAKFLFVENGSTDDSYNKILSLTKSDNRFEVIRSQKGLGAALREGMKYVYESLQTKDSILILTGADLPFGFSDLDNYLGDKTENKYDIYIGSKAHNLSQIDRTFSRKIMSKVFNFLIRLFFKVNIGDTQGTYVINLNNVNLLKILPTSDNFFATAEICIKAIEFDYKIIEMPITLIGLDKDKSTVKVFRDTLKIFKEMLYFKFKN